MRYLMIGLVGLMLSGCATAQLQKKVEMLEHVVVGQEKVIQGHDKILIYILNQMKKGLFL
jgi:predicted ThiF/HesA family dinucleotide-utilizing enzyme